MHVRQEKITPDAAFLASSAWTRDIQITKTTGRDAKGCSAIEPVPGQHCCTNCMRPSFDIVPGGVPCMVYIPIVGLSLLTQKLSGTTLLCAVLTPCRGWAMLCLGIIGACYLYFESQKNEISSFKPQDTNKDTNNETASGNHSMAAVWSSQRDVR